MARRAIISFLAASAALIAVPVSAAEQGAANRSHPQTSDERQPTAKKAPWTATEPAPNPRTQKAQKTKRPAAETAPRVQKQQAPRTTVIAAPKVKPHHAVRHAVFAPWREPVKKAVHVEQAVQVQEAVQMQPVVSYVTQPVVRHVTPPVITLVGGPKPAYLTFDAAPRYQVQQRATYTSIPVAYTPARAYVEEVAMPVVSYVPVAASWKACQYGAYVGHAPHRCGAHYYRSQGYRPYGAHQSYYGGHAYGVAPYALGAED